MSRRDADLRAPRRSRGRAPRDLRPADLPGRRGAAGRRRRPGSGAGRGRRTDLPRPVHAARLLRRARVQRQAVHRRRLLLLGRPDAPAPVGQLRGRGPQEGPDQPRRRKDQRRGNREPDPHAPGRAERRLRRDARSEPGREDVRLRHPARRAHADAQGTGRLPARQGNRQLQAAGAAGTDARISRCRPSARCRRRRWSKWSARNWKWSAHANHRPALLSRHERMDHRPGALRRRAGQVLEQDVGAQGGRRTCSRSSPAPASRRCWSRSIWRRPSPRRPAPTSTCTRCGSATPSASSRPGARSSRPRARSPFGRRSKAVKELGFIGFHFHPIMQHFAVNDTRYYPLFEEISAWARR